MNVKDFLAQFVVALTTTAIASLIGFIFKGRLTNLFDNFVNRKNSALGVFFGYVTLIWIVIIPVFLIESLKIESVYKGIILSLYIFVLLIYFRFVVLDTGKYSFSFIKGSLTERTNWIQYFGKPEFVCNVDGIDVAFYSVDVKLDRIVYVPVDIENLDMSKWADVDQKLSNLTLHLDSIDKLKSALGCS